jgi:hypothetical protein
VSNLTTRFLTVTSESASTSTVNSVVPPKSLIESILTTASSNLLLNVDEAGFPLTFKLSNVTIP